MQHTLISIWVIKPLYWIQMLPKSVPLSFLGETIPTSNYQWVLQVLQTFSKQNVRANGIPRVCTNYLDNLLCISRSSHEDNLEKLEEVLFRRLCNAGLKVNAETSTFCALEIEYLGYVLTRDGIKPQSNKVQAILAMQLPKGVKQLKYVLGKVQYYRDLWARRSKMLVPLTSLVGECGQTKVTKAKGTKKVPWHWEEFHQCF